MKTRNLLFAVLIVTFVGVSAAYGAPARGSIPRVPLQTLTPCHISLGEYFAVSEKKLVDIGRRFPLSEDDLVVALFIATRSNQDPLAIAALRRKGMAWGAVAEYLGYSDDILDRSVFGEEVFSSPLRAMEEEMRRSGKGKAKAKGKAKGKASKATDRDFIIKANVKFLSEHFGVSRGRIVKMVGKGRRFIDIESVLHGEAMGRGAKGKGKKGRKGRGR